jgi:hypothetical protein
MPLAALVVILGDSGGDITYSGPGPFLTAYPIEGTYSNLVQIIPEPGRVWMLVVGVIALLIAKRKSQTWVAKRSFAWLGRNKTRQLLRGFPIGSGDRPCHAAHGDRRRYSALHGTLRFPFRGHFLDPIRNRPGPGARTHRQPAGLSHYRDAEDKYDSSVVLDFDYTVLMPRRAQP